MSLDGARRELKRLREKLRADDREFRAAAPPVDSEGMPDWDGSNLSVDVYERALDGDLPDEELTSEELATRHRLAPFAEVFEQLQRDENEEEPVT